MNEELIKQCVREVCPGVEQPGSGEQNYRYAAAVMAIETYHARHVAPLVEALRAVTPITIHNTPDYAEMTFGTSQTQAMTMEPQKWEAVNAALAPFQQEAQ